jgi:hypothetical protein
VCGVSRMYDVINLNVDVVCAVSRMYDVICTITSVLVLALCILCTCLQCPGPGAGSSFGDLLFIPGAERFVSYHSSDVESSDEVQTHPFLDQDHVLFCFVLIFNQLLQLSVLRH